MNLKFLKPEVWMKHEKYFYDRWCNEEIKKGLRAKTLKFCGFPGTLKTFKQG